MAKKKSILKDIFSILTASFLALSLSFLTLSPQVGANTETPIKNKKVEKSVEKTADKRMAKKRKEIMSEATVAIKQTQKAIKFLDKGNKKKALQALEKATGKLSMILAREPTLALAPVDVVSVTYETLSSIDTIKDIRDQAEDLLEDGRIQEARHLIKNLASEAVISTTNIPLATYPNAIKGVVRLIDAGKLKEAKMALRASLSTLVVTDVIVPLPIFSAQALLKEAEKLAENKERKKEQNDRLTELLETVENKIKLAEALGYGTEDQIDNFSDELKKIRKKTSDGKSGTGFFDGIKLSMKSILGGGQESSSKGS